MAGFSYNGAQDTAASGSGGAAGGAGLGCPLVGESVSPLLAGPRGTTVPGDSVCTCGINELPSPGCDVTVRRKNKGWLAATYNDNFTFNTFFGL